VPFVPPRVKRRRRDRTTVTTFVKTTERCERV